MGRQPDRTVEAVVGTVVQRDAYGHERSPGGQVEPARRVTARCTAELPEIRAFEGKDVTATWAREDGHLLEQ